MKCTSRLQLSRVLLLLSGVFLCTLYHLTISARLFTPLPEVLIGGSTEGVEEAAVETQGLEEPLTAAVELEPTDPTTPEMHVVHHPDTSSDLEASTPTTTIITTQFQTLPTTNRTIVHCIYVAPEPPQETPTPAPAPAPPVTTITPASPGEAPHVKGEYPEDLFSIKDRRRGWVILHIFGMIYMFIALAIVCDEFFVPALGVITDKLAISDDVAGATFMAAGRSIPSFFALFIGVFIAHSNVGIGTIVGSAVFNILFVIGMCALFSREALHLTWWPLFRDVSFYILDLILLIIFFLDHFISWWESMLLVASYALYVTFMKFNVQIEQAFKTQLYKHQSIVKIIAVKEPEKDDVSAGEQELGVSEDAERGQKEDTDEDRDDSSKNKDDENVAKKDKPLSLKWPASRHKQANYLFLLPIIFPLWLTLPDVRNEKSRKFFVVTFLCSTVWIAVFSYHIIWWAIQVGETIGISHQIISILAAGASSPDLITSVIVARKGLGDMAVSSSVGSNIFHITVGLPVPWLLYSSIHGLAPVTVCNNGIICAAVLLFLMLFFFIIFIACCKWKLNKVLGFKLLLLYFIFLVISLTLKYRIIVCPVALD